MLDIPAAEKANITNRIITSSIGSLKTFLKLSLPSTFSIFINIPRRRDKIAAINTLIPI